MPLPNPSAAPVVLAERRSPSAPPQPSSPPERNASPLAPDAPLEPDASPLDAVLQLPLPPAPRRRVWDGVFVARLGGVNRAGLALLSLPEMPIMPPAASMVTLDPQDVGRSVAVMFQQGDVRRPMVIGWMQGAAERDAATPLQARVDDDRLELVANREIVLRCGRASITLTRSGKVLIRGAYVSSRSSGANCIKGASVQIN